MAAGRKLIREATEHANHKVCAGQPDWIRVAFQAFELMSALDRVENRLNRPTETTGRRFDDLETSVAKLNEMFASLRVASFDGRLVNGYRQLVGQTEPPR